MEVFIEPVSGPDPAERSRRLVAVAIDALRASVTIATALHLGAEKVVPVASLEEAKSLQKNKNILIAGERAGKWVEGFDFGNSPGQLIENSGRLKGAVLVLTTSNGTKTILRAAGTRAVVVGCLPNLSAAVEKIYALAQKHEADIALFPAGWLGEEAEEDLFTAGLMGRKLTQLGARFRPDRDVARMLDRTPEDLFTKSDAGKLLASLGYQEDVLRCAQIDTYNIVPVYKDGVLKIG